MACGPLSAGVGQEAAALAGSAAAADAAAALPGSAVAAVVAAVVAPPSSWFEVLHRVRPAPSCLLLRFVAEPRLAFAVLLQLLPGSP